MTFQSAQGSSPPSDRTTATEVRWALPEAEATHVRLPYSVGMIRRQVEFVTSPHKGLARPVSEKDRRVRPCPRSQQACAEVSRRSEDAASRQTQSHRHHASKSPFSEGMLEYEFSKKFKILTFNCYSSQSDPIQHLSQYRDKMVIHARNDFIARGGKSRFGFSRKKLCFFCVVLSFLSHS